MHAWEQIQQTLDYIEDHLAQEMGMEQLAKQANLSPFYFQRLFRRLVKKPPAEYIKLRRVAKGLELLKQQDRRILDIALDLGFSTHQQFSRTFKETFNMTPEEYRKNPQFLNCMTKPELLLNYTMIEEDVPLVVGDIVLEVTQKQLNEPCGFMGMRLDMPVGFIDGLGTESGGNSLDTLWRDMHQREKELFGDMSYEGVGVTLPSQKEGHFCYFAGVKAVTDTIPEGLIPWQLPAGRYVVCSFEAETFEKLVTDVLYKAQQYLFGSWLPKHEIKTEPFCAERYPSHGKGTTNMEVWLKIAE